MRRTFTIFAIVILALTIMPMTTYAHGHRGGVTVNWGYNLCNVENCNVTGTHEHDGVTCFGHYSNDGHNYHNTSIHKGNRHH